MPKSTALFARLTVCGSLLVCTGCPELLEPLNAADNPDVGMTANNTSNTSTDMDVVDEGPPIVAPPGFTTARVLYRGSEAMLFQETAAHALELDGYGVTGFSVSGDGQVVWLALYNEFAPEGPTYKVFSMNVDGSNVEEHSFVRPPDAPYFPGGFQVVTTDDGEIAILTQYTYDSEDRVVAEFSRASRGSSFSVLTTSDGAVEGLGLAEGVSTQVTDDGSAIMYSTGRHLWRANESDGWVPFVVYRIEDLMWNGNGVPGNAVLRGLDITDNGGEFVTRANLTPDETAIIVGTGIGATAIEHVYQGDHYATAEIDSVGEWVTYGHPGPAQNWLGQKGGTYERIDPPADGAMANADLADGGEYIHANVLAPKPIPFFQHIPTGERVASMSQQWSIFGMVPGIGGQLSDDGSIFLTRTWGLLAVHRDRVAYGAHVDAVFWRIDEEDNLVIRAQVRAEQQIVSVNVMPLFDRHIRPSFLYDSFADPTWSMRNGLELAELEDEPGTYEVTVQARPDATEPLDERFSFRLLVGQSEDGETTTSTGFVDFDLFE